MGGEDDLFVPELRLQLLDRIIKGASFVFNPLHCLLLDQGIVDGQEIVDCHRHHRVGGHHRRHKELLQEKVVEVDGLVASVD